MLGHYLLVRRDDVLPGADCPRDVTEGRFLAGEGIDDDVDIGVLEEKAVGSQYFEAYACQTGAGLRDITHDDPCELERSPKLTGVDFAFLEQDSGDTSPHVAGAEERDSDRS